MLSDERGFLYFCTEERAGAYLRVLLVVVHKMTIPFLCKATILSCDARNPMAETYLL